MAHMCFGLSGPTDENLSPCFGFRLTIPRQLLSPPRGSRFASRRSAMSQPPLCTANAERAAVGRESGLENRHAVRFQEHEAKHLETKPHQHETKDSKGGRHETNQHETQVWKDQPATKHLKGFLREISIKPKADQHETRST